jgi:hypothetical protein
VTAPAPLATPEQVAAWLQKPETYLARLRSNGTGPKFIKRGRTIRYAWADVHTWANEGRSNGAS